MAIMPIARALAIAALIAASPAAAAGDDLQQSFFEQRFCAAMALEVRAPQQIRVDCASATHAIEVEFHDLWRAGLGQALAYAAAMGLHPGMVIVCRSDEAHCRASSLGLRATLTRFTISATIWECLPIDRSLDDCLRLECGAGACDIAQTGD